MTRNTEGTPAQAEALLVAYTEGVVALSELMEKRSEPSDDEMITRTQHEVRFLRDQLLRLLAQQPAPANAESITIDEFIRREGPNWEGKDAQAYVRNLRDGNESTLTEENRRLREALAWFADDKNWYGLPDPESGWFSPATVEGRGRARAALSPEVQP